MIPTSIDGTDITGATIDGTDVTEITVDGQTVFTAGPNLPVAYSNLVAWYPFDSAEYGGSNADDVTALFNPAQSGDSTAYDGTVNGATYQSSGGVTDINAGANSGGYQFDGSNDHIDLPSFTGSYSEFSMGYWIRPDVQSTDIIMDHFESGQDYFRTRINGDGTVRWNLNDSTGPGPGFDSTGSYSVGNWNHIMGTYSSTNGVELYIDGVSVATDSSTSGTYNPSGQNRLGAFTDNAGIEDYDGNLDDVRWYDVELTSTQINQIYQNTQP